ncbi:hypothetical protein FB45DRAFT_875462 [Roridomyces roridus]|uniref:Uncharacterized protein n=1 Tax=Roridomyces roridus TaxID=1738132 RepID=A0AAD7B6I6_9AGAR|nr:hypothetical protein FB45DRAFT_875462 [Roridomyces roridus]
MASKCIPLALDPKMGEETNGKLGPLSCHSLALGIKLLNNESGQAATRSWWIEREKEELPTGLKGRYYFDTTIRRLQFPKSTPGLSVGIGTGKPAELFTPVSTGSRRHGTIHDGSAAYPRVTGMQLGYRYPYPRRVNPSTRAGTPHEDEEEVLDKEGLRYPTLAFILPFSIGSKRIQLLLSFIHRAAPMSSFTSMTMTITHLVSFLTRPLMRAHAPKTILALQQHLLAAFTAPDFMATEFPSGKPGSDN